MPFALTPNSAANKRCVMDGCIFSKASIFFWVVLPVVSPKNGFAAGNKDSPTVDKSINKKNLSSSTKSLSVADKFDKKQDEHRVFILAGIHAAAQFVTALPQGGVEFGFFEGHGLSQVLLSSIEISGAALPREGKET